MVIERKNQDGDEYGNKDGDDDEDGNKDVDLTENYNQNGDLNENDNQDGAMFRSAKNIEKENTWKKEAALGKNSPEAGTYRAILFFQNRINSKTVIIINSIR